MAKIQMQIAKDCHALMMTKPKSERKYLEQMMYEALIKWAAEQ